MIVRQVHQGRGGREAACEVRRREGRAPWALSVKERKCVSDPVTEQGSSLTLDGVEGIWEARSLCCFPGRAIYTVHCQLPFGLISPKNVFKEMQRNSFLYSVFFPQLISQTSECRGWQKSL